MTTNVTIKPPIKELREKYRQIHKEVASFHTLYSKIAIFLDKWTKDNFKTQGGKVGGWVPLKAGGRRRKGKFDISAKILQDTGRLRLSHLPFTTNDAGGIGSDLPYAEAHNKGFGPLPVRRTLPEKAEVLPDVMKIADHHAKQAIKKGLRK